MSNNEETKVVDTTENVQQNVDTKTETVPQETQEQINWRSFRQQREQDRKAREEAQAKASAKEAEAQALKAAMEAILNKPQAQTHYQEPEEETEDQRIQKKVDEALKERDKRYAQERAEREAQELPQRIQQAHPDFNDVVTQENLDYLEYHYPEIAGAFKHSPENFNHWSNLYKTMKKLIPSPNSKKDERKAEKNLTKPQSMSIPGATATGDVTPVRLDDQRRQDNWQRMQRVMRGGK